MAEPFGEVTIDGINTKEIGLHDLRKNLSIIPQVHLVNGQLHKQETMTGLWCQPVREPAVSWNIDLKFRCMDVPL